LRREHAAPKLAEIGQWLLETKAEVLPKSPVGQAVDYTLSNWKALNRYTTDAALAIDNNAAEQAVRAIALGRNYAESQIMWCRLGRGCRATV